MIRYVNVCKFFSGNNFDEYPNEMNTLPKNLQQLVTEAMKTMTFESSTTTSNTVDNGCTQ